MSWEFGERVAGLTLYYRQGSSGDVRQGISQIIRERSDGVNLHWLHPLGNFVNVFEIIMVFDSVVTDACNTMSKVISDCSHQRVHCFLSIMHQDQGVGCNLACGLESASKGGSVD